MIAYVILAAQAVGLALLFYDLVLVHRIYRNKLATLYVQKEQELEVLRAGTRELQQKLASRASSKRHK